VPFPMSTPEDLAETAALVEAEGLENPGPKDLEPICQMFHTLPVPWVEPIDISNAVVYLASDESRYVTGVPLPIDAGSMLK